MNNIVNITLHKSTLNAMESESKQVLDKRARNWSELSYFAVIGLNILMAVTSRLKSFSSSELPARIEVRI